MLAADPRLAAGIHITVDHTYDEFPRKVVTARRTTPEMIDASQDTAAWSVDFDLSAPAYG